MRISKTWTVSLPPPMEREATQVARREHRTKSELVREALRVYLAQREWQALQQRAAQRAAARGLRSEADVEHSIDELRR